MLVEVARLIVFFLALNPSRWSSQFAAADRATEDDTHGAALRMLKERLEASRLEREPRSAGPTGPADFEPHGTMRGILWREGVQILVELNPWRDITCHGGSTPRNDVNKLMMKGPRGPYGAHGEKCKLGVKVEFLSTPALKTTSASAYRGFSDDRAKAASWLKKGGRDISHTIYMEGSWWPRVPAFKAKIPEYRHPDRLGVMAPDWKDDIPADHLERLGVLRLPWSEAFVTFDFEGATFQFCWCNPDGSCNWKGEWPQWNDHCDSFRMNLLPAGKDRNKVYHGVYYLRPEDHLMYSGPVAMSVEIDLAKWSQDGETLKGVIDWRLQRVPREALQFYWEYIGDPGQSYVTLKKEGQGVSACFAGEAQYTSCGGDPNECPFLKPGQYAMKITPQGYILLQDRTDLVNAQEGTGDTQLASQNMGSLLQQDEPDSPLGGASSRGGTYANIRQSKGKIYCPTVLMMPIWKTYDEIKQVTINLQNYDPFINFDQERMKPTPSVLA